MSAFQIFACSCKPARIILCNGLMKDVKYTLARSKSTVNIKEIEQFSKLKNDWWDENGLLSGLHQYNPFRIQFVRDGLANTGFKEQTLTLPLQGIKIADVGCGGGILAEGLARAGAKVTGIDASNELINIAKQHVALDPDLSKRINYIHTTVEEFSGENEELYDAVISSEVIEHVNNKELFLKESVKLLKPGGSIFITTLNRTLSCWLIYILIAEYITNIISCGTHNWNNFIRPHELQRILDMNGCKTGLSRGVKFNLITEQWSWSSSTTYFYCLHAIKQKEIDT